ncbi:MAG: 2-phosphosulfolactate phosphatase [Erysipelotrichaceae bacterium]|nr:2-phosphosulfolactate phosphatase [Erysipelotrichaceae bacterium]
MKISIYDLIDGAREARGLTVIIDVFRAFSLEAYLFSHGVEKIYPIGTIEEAFALKEKNPDFLLIGERGGKKVEGFDFGNSPSAFNDRKLYGKSAIHTTSAGTQGIDNAVNAEEILVASFVNAAATAEYIRERNPEVVSLVCMGNAGIAPAGEDRLCAEYIRSLLIGEPMADIDVRLLDLRNTDGKKFFDEKQKEVFPEPDFWMCIRRDIFPFVIKTYREEGRNVNRMLLIDGL